MRSRSRFVTASLLLFRPCAPAFAFALLAGSTGQAQWQWQEQTGRRGGFSFDPQDGNPAFGYGQSRMVEVGRGGQFSWSNSGNGGGWQWAAPRTYDSSQPWSFRGARDLPQFTEPWLLTSPQAAERDQQRPTWMQRQSGSWNTDDPGLAQVNQGELEATTRPCTNCGTPTANGPVDVEQTVRELVRSLPGPQDRLENRSISRLAWGARRAMGTIYQNCDALRMGNLIPGDWLQPGVDPAIDGDDVQAGTNLLRRTPYEFFDPNEIARSSWYMRRGQVDPACRDISRSPPVFYVGGKPRIRTSDGNTVVNMLTPARRPPGRSPDEPSLNAIDCSGFMGASFAAAGLRIRPGSDQFLQPASILAGLSGSNSCFQPVQFSATESIRSGDVFGISGTVFGHALMIESVGPDPWGLRFVRSAEQCMSGLPWRNFDFTIIQSGNRFNRPAVSRSHANHYLANAAAQTRAQFAEMARLACQAKFSGRPVRATVPNARGVTERSIIRHVGSANPACVTEPASFGATGSCMDNCADADRGRPESMGEVGQ